MHLNSGPSGSSRLGRPEADITERRRFYLVDGITLVAAAALMLSADRAVIWLWSWWGDVPSYNHRE
ncbi:MAG TPA: hypothetical protein VGZ22_08910, partial [Isosphaeraceae bacterium]|nr:hypothetical protein [Isosphaeraceae bacterium]